MEIPWRLQVKATLTLAILLIILATPASTAGWTEELHPREHGRFSNSWGPPFVGYKPERPLDHESPGNNGAGVYTYGSPSQSFTSNVRGMIASAPANLKRDAGNVSLHVFDSVPTFRGVTGMRDASNDMLGFTQHFANQQYSRPVTGLGPLDPDPSHLEFEKSYSRLAFMETSMSKLSVIEQRQTVLHEMFHAVDQNTGASHDKAFIEAFKKDVNAQTVQKLSKDGLSAYADDPREAFAEAGSQLIQPTNDAEAADFSADFPNVLAYMQMVMKRVGVLTPGGNPASESSSSISNSGPGITIVPVHRTNVPGPPPSPDLQ
jgi:hypothetical protein